MDLYSLPKDMLVKLITTIRSETIKEFDNKLNTMMFTSSEAEFLYNTACRNFYNEQEVFDLINENDNPKEISEDGTMFWCKKIADAVHLKNFLMYNNQKSVIILDDGNDTPFVVLSDYKWEKYMYKIFLFDEN